MIIQVEAFQVLGIMEHYTHGEEDFSGIWKRFMMFHLQISPLSTDKAFYGVYWETENKELDYLAGMKVQEVETILEGQKFREVPGGLYAVFECTVKTIGDTYDYIFDKWFPTSPYEHDQRPDFDYYPPHTVSRNTPVTANMAIKEKKIE